MVPVAAKNEQEFPARQNQWPTVQSANGLYLADSLGQGTVMTECGWDTGLVISSSAGPPIGWPESFLEVQPSRGLFFSNIPSFPTLSSSVSDLYRYLAGCFSSLSPSFSQALPPKLLSHS